MAEKKDRTTRMSLEQKRQCIEPGHGKLSIRRQCELIGLPRSSYYRRGLGSDESLENLALMRLHGASVTYRIALGPRQGRKVFTLQTIPASDLEPWVGKVDGFSLHAGVAAKACQRKKLERICRYIARPPVAEKRLSLTRNGMVRYELKTPYRDGTTHVIFEPLDFISKLAALVPKPRVNLTRFHGVFAPNSKHRTLVTPGRRGKGRKIGVSDDTQIKPPEKCRASLNWA